MNRTVEIVGGGLAGLALGLALRRHDVPVVVHERGAYPRHRVCGEFIRGLDERTLRELELAPLLADARRHREVAWFWREQPLRLQRLAPPAFAVSRETLDARLADTFTRAGGELRTHSPAPLDPAEGRVLACGRATTARSPWIGLKVHLHRLALARGLEMHLGRNAYVGLCALPGDRVNLCGLFPRPPTPTASSALLDRALREADLGALADRVAAATPVEGSFCAMAGLVFGQPRAPLEAPRLGDALGMIPPFTGNGMAIAFASARLATEPLANWSRGAASWRDTVAELRRRLERKFRPRVALARACHPWLLAPGPQRVVAQAAAHRILPLAALTRALS